MPVNAEIWTEREDWRRSWKWSAGLHAIFFGGILLYGVLVGGWRGDEWGGSGGGGGAMTVGMVSSIPLPANPNGTNVVANESKGTSQTQPKVEEKAPPDAIPIPARQAKRKPWEKAPRTVNAKPEPVETASNVVPYGQGGPTISFSASNAQGGFGFTGGSGDFGSKYAWYVDQVRRKVAENWLRAGIDPGVSEARRVFITFDIVRSGQPQNVQIEQSSGVPSLDQSALWALQRIDSFGPLPSDYSGSKVSVEFWFDYHASK